MKKVVSRKLVGMFVLAAMFAVTGAQAHHEDGDVEVHCSTRNARGFVFEAQATTSNQRDALVWRQVQDQANLLCQSSSLICRELGCYEIVHPNK